MREEGQRGDVGRSLKMLMEFGTRGARSASDMWWLRKCMSDCERKFVTRSMSMELLKERNLVMDFLAKGLVAVLRQVGLLCFV